MATSAYTVLVSKFPHDEGHYPDYWATPSRRGLFYAPEQRFDVCGIRHFDDGDLATPQGERDEIRARPTFLEIMIKCDIALRHKKDVCIKSQEGCDVMFMLGQLLVGSSGYAISTARNSDRFRQHALAPGHHDTRAPGIPVTGGIALAALRHS